jgi:uncharacterized phiE125 gp8 family phage protein
VQLTLLTPPDHEPLCDPISGDVLPLLRAHVRSDLTEDEPTLRHYAAAAREVVETHEEVQLLTATWRLTAETWPTELPKRPVQEIISITYRDPSGTMQTLPLERIQTTKRHGWTLLRPVPGDTWPRLQRDRVDAVTIDFAAGWDIDNVPKAYVQAMLLIIGEWYAQREDSSGQALHPISNSARALLAQASSGVYR